ncbi:MAG: gliding motility-associated C-terminal domain-containing protein [Bacteroidetes bacterium]|nr:gliding motility-associated C-terminal domain-containing protein [Bacteroidota bacterium]
MSWPRIAVAQGNIVPDSSFEMLKEIPYDGCLARKDSFNRYSLHWFDPTAGSSGPNLLSLHYKNGVLKLPYVDLSSCGEKSTCNFNEFILQPKSGSNFVSILYWYNGNEFSPVRFYKEYLETPLYKIEKNSKYKISFYYSRFNPKFQYSKFSPFGMFFSKNKLLNLNLNSDDSMRTDFRHQVFPNVEFDNLFYPSNIPQSNRIWVHTDTIIKLTLDYQYLTMGYFGRIPRIDYSKDSSNYCMIISTIYLDDLSITPYPCIVGPDTLCYGSRIPYTSTVPGPRYWSLSASGKDTLTTADTVFFDTENWTRLYSFGAGWVDSIIPVIFNPPNKSHSLFQTNCANEFKCIGYNAKPGYTVEWSNHITGNIQCNISKGRYITQISTVYGCNFSDTWEVKIIDTPDLRPIDTIVCNETQSVQAIQIPLNPAYIYTMNGAAKSSPFQLEQGRYYVVARDTAGCRSATFWNSAVDCKPVVYIPNSTGKNSINKTFAPSILYCKSAELSIYNRWGELVYRETSKNPEWKPSEQAIIAGSNYAYKLVVYAQNSDAVLHFSGIITVL